LVEHQSTGKGTNIEAALEFLNGVTKKKAIVFLLSDFLAEGYEKSFNITARKHDFTALRVFDNQDEALPNVGLLPAIDPETGRMGWINTGSRKVRQHYWLQCHGRISALRDYAKKSGAGLVEINTGHNYVTKLISYFKQREARR
jgi:hypothetical protein